MSAVEFGLMGEEGELVEEFVAVELSGSGALALEIGKTPLSEVARVFWYCGGVIIVYTFV
jgi:hypothetical protein